MGWHGEPLVGFDLETTGTEPLEARIVTAAVIAVRDGAVEEWPAREAADEIASTPAGYGTRGVPVVAYGTSFCPRTQDASRVFHGEARRRLTVHAGMRAA
ncbi:MULTISPECIES: hypothetical protein [unclassified Streptomyces]|uniref:hypothetical protein n=1 Tax=unclassified Streptomyces TaxID=2593676 RepID=UPI00386BF9C5